MSTIVTRAGKGSPLTHNEVDANFTNLNTDKYQSGDNVSFGAVTATSFSGDGGSVINVDAATLGGDSKAQIFASAQAEALDLAIALG